MLTPPGGVITDDLQPAATNAATASTSSGLMQREFLADTWLCFIILTLCLRGVEAGGAITLASVSDRNYSIWAKNPASSSIGISLARCPKRSTVLTPTIIPCARVINTLTRYLTPHRRNALT